MPRLRSKSFATPDNVRTSPRVRCETMGIYEATTGLDS